MILTIWQKKKKHSTPVYADKIPKPYSLTYMTNERKIQQYQTNVKEKRKRLQITMILRKNSSGNNSHML